MKQLSRTLWDAFVGAMLATGLLRVVIALTAAAEPDVMSGQTEAAGFLPQILGGEFYVTASQFTLMHVMAATVLVAACAWGIARTLADADTRAEG
ncbi:MAG: hypothetical protein IT548_02280 [Alphaproteobacteria bacterium]|nr:hypothetical protein [Alphaproteobacteria bacterium]